MQPDAFLLSLAVIELANLVGNAYVIGLSNHWRNLEKESGRDIFLTNFLEPKTSREIRKNIYAKCQDYLDKACCKNKNEKDMEGIELVEHQEQVKMSEEEGVLYKKSQSGINAKEQSFAITPENFDVTAGHDVSKFLRQNAKLACRGQKLIEVSTDPSKRLAFSCARVIPHYFSSLHFSFAIESSLKKGTPLPKSSFSLMAESELAMWLEIS